MYLDDVLIFSRTPAEHQTNVPQRLLENCLYVKAQKCEFHTSTVSFVGFVISGGQVKTDPQFQLQPHLLSREVTFDSQERLATQ